MRSAGLTVLATLAVIACTATTAMRSGTEAPGVISDVRVEKVGETTRVVLVGLDHPVFTAFQQRNPERVVIDLASVAPIDVLDPVEVMDGLVEVVSVAPFSTGAGDSMTRVEVALSHAADYRVNPSPEGLEIIFESAAANAEMDLLDGFAADGLALDDALEEPANPWAIEPLRDEEPEIEAAISAIAWEAPPATELVGIDASATSDREGVLIHLLANGTVSSAVTFTIVEPDRLVIDLPGMTSAMTKDRVAVDSDHAWRVRVGRHEDKVRVVVDGTLKSDGFNGRRIVPLPDGLLVTLGEGRELDQAVASMGTRARSGMAMQAVPDASASQENMDLEQAIETLKAEENSANTSLPADFEEAWALAGGEESADLLAAPEPTFGLALAAALPEAAPLSQSAAPAGAAPTLIYGVEYSAQEGLDQILVFGKRPVDYLVYEPDPETIVLSIENAVIAPAAAVRIAPVTGGPVSLISAFEQPDVASSEVRVVVKRASGLEPEIHRKGNLLLMDFPRTGEIAAQPPILAAAAAQVAAVSAAVATDAPAAVAARAEAGPQEPVPAALEPPAAIALLEEGGLRDGKEYLGRRISLDFKEVDIADVLRLVAEVSDLNVIAGDEVKGSVTIRLVDVPWDQALDVILLTKGLGFVRVGNVLRIAPATLLKQEDELRLQERRNLETLQDLVVKLQPVNYANVADVSSMVQRLLTPRGTVNTDERTNTLMIKDIPTVIDEATALIKAIDTQTPQVMIEAKIVEANLDFSREFGSSWSFGTQPLIDGFAGDSGPRTDLGGRDFRFHDENNFVFGNPVAGTAGVFNLATFLIDEKMNLDLKLQAAEANGDGKVISSPRIVTLDNTKATIEQGVSIPFQTFENGDAQLEFIDAVLKLNVTPHITGDRSIIMKIEVSRNAPDDSVFTLTGSPAIAKNQVKTETLVADGQTLVLGGIYVLDKSNTSSGVPFLKDIPILGWAFKNKIVKDNRKELLMFVSPRIILNAPAAI